MDKNTERKLEILSRIDDDIIEKQTKQRIFLMSGRKKKKSPKKWFITGGALAAAAAIILAMVLILVPMLAKQVPIYTGMTVSGELTAGQASTGNVTVLELNGEGSGAQHKGHYQGDFNYDRGDLSNPFDKPLSDTLNVVGGGEERYYAKPGEDIYITVHIDNPDNFEILSFTLNGQKYSSYMFEEGSDMENLILKVNVGNAEGVVEYTIDAIKYVDGNEIKDVRMEGDRTIEIGVYTENQPTAAVSAESIAYNSISFTVTAADLMDLVKDSDGKLEAVLYDGNSIVAKQAIAAKGETRITFDGLGTNTLYQYAILATYDALDGQGISTYILAQKAFYTKAVVLFDHISLSTTGVNFALDWDSAITDQSLLDLSIYQGNTKVGTLDTSATTVSDLIPDTAYTLVATYRNGTGTETIRLEFTTDPLTYTVNHLKEKLDGTYELVSTATDVIAFGADITPAVNAYTGFTSPATQTVTGSTEVALEVNYYYPRTAYTLTFVRNDGAAADTLSLKYGYEIPGDTRDYFGGWFTDETLTQLTYTVPATDVTLYAKWDNETSAELLTYTGLETLTVTGFKEGVNINNLVIPAYIGGKRVAGISDRAFNGYTQLAAVTVPATVTQMGQNAFGSCNGLASITLPFVGASASGDIAAYFGYIFGAAKAEDNNYYIPSSLKRVTLTGNVGVPDSAFLGCTWLESVALGARVPAIGANAFEGCTGLSSLSLAANGALATIGDSAFNGCKGLTSLTIPTNVTSIGAAAFEGLINLTQINFNAKAINALSVDTFSGAGSNGNGVTVTFGANVTKVPNYLFAHEGAEGKTSPNIKTVTFAKGSVCTGINGWAFLNCTSLQSVTLPPSLKTIYTCAFYNTSMTSLEIPAGVTDIKTWAFANSTLLKNVTFAGTALKNIGNDAFSGCAMLNGVTLPDSVTTIGSGMFQNCTSLSSITVPAGVTTLPTSIFYGCTSLKTATLEGVTSIGNNAFENCSLLETVSLPEGLLTIGQYAFNTCSALKSVSLPSTLTGIYSYAFSATGLAAIEIPANVGTVGQRVFSDCPALEQVIFKGDKQTAINPGTFANCSALTEITIPASVMSIGTDAFNGCTKLASLTFEADSKLTSVKSNSFTNCPITTATIPVIVISVLPKSSLTTVCINGGTTLPDNAFSNVTTLTSITLCEGITVIGNYALSKTGITAIDLPASVTSIGNYAFRGTKLTKIDLPAGLQSIGSSAFRSVGLTAITLPQGLTTIGSYAFAETGLTSVTVPKSVTSLGSSAFSDCTALQSAILEEGIALSNSTLNANMFNGCSRLSSVSLPVGLTTIGANAFLNCTSLTEIAIPADVTSFGESAFSGAGLTRVDYAGTLADWCGMTFANAAANPVSVAGSLYIGGTNTITATFAIPEAVTSIGAYAFYGCTGITELNLPGGLTEVGTDAFMGCTGITKAIVPTAAIGKFTNVNLEYLEINGGTKIPESAFAYYTKLTEVVIAKTVTSMGADIFEGCTAVEKITTPVYGYLPKSIKTLILQEGVTSLGGTFFEGFTELTTLYLPVSLKNLDSYAFLGCSSLTHVEYAGTLEDWCNISIEDDSYEANPLCFAHNLYINGVNVTSGRLTIPEGVKRIGPLAFAGCHNITEVVLPSTLVSLDVTAFNRCYKLMVIYNLSSVTFDYGDGGSYGNNFSTVKHVYTSTSVTSPVFTNDNGYIFYESGSTRYLLGYTGTETKLTLPADCNGSTYTLHQYAFYNCTWLEGITLPACVTSVSTTAFEGCRNLASIAVDSANKTYHSAGNCLIATSTKELVLGCKTSVIPTDGSVTAIGSSAFRGLPFRQV